MSFPGHYEVDDNHAGPSSRPADHYTPDSRDGRRPWSPINYNDEVAPQGRNDYFSRIREWDTGGRGRVRKQEASEDSIEALDLADYARTLRRPEVVHDSPYPPFPVTSHVHPLSIPTPQTPTNPQPLFAAYAEYPPSPPPVRPFSVQSRDTFSQAPPSLISGESTYETQESYTTGRPYDPRHRPYSLPSFLAPVPDEYLSNRGPAIFSATSTSLQRSLVRVASPTFEDPDAGDISRFPPFSRHWFDDPSTKSKSGGGPRTSLPAYSDLSPPPPSLGSRNVLPWSARESDSGPPIDESTKQERMRMLEYEFGKEGKYDADGDEPVVGSVDEKGALITSGPKKRAAARWAQGLFGLATVVSSVYGALFIKSPTPAPPSGQAPAFTLYGVSIISFLLTFYLFVIRPCCCGRRKKEGHLPGGTLPGGLVALPIQSLPGGKKAKKRGKKGKKGDPESGGDVQVNLIVDPGLFNPRHREDSGDDDEDFDGSQWSSRTRRRGGKGNGRRPRRSVFEGFAMETEWRYARIFLKKIFALDVLCCLVWAAVFVFVLFGKRCPSGQFNGWCDSYNLATAATAFTCLAFAFSTYFDIVDLHASRASPRTRT